MAYVTEDPRVRKLVQAWRDGIMTRSDCAAAIRDLLPQPRAHRGYLEWEIQEALAS